MKVPRRKKGAATIMAVVLAVAMCVPISAWAGDEILPAEESTTIIGAGEVPDGGAAADDVVADGSGIEDGQENNVVEGDEGGAKTQQPEEDEAVLQQVGSVKAQRVTMPEPRAPFVAKIGSQGFATLVDAFDAVPKDGTPTTITLVDDATIDSPKILPAGSDIVLDLAGHTVHASKAITIRGDLTIRDSAEGGRIEGAASGLLKANGNMTLSIESGEITTTGATAVLVNNAGAEFKMTGGTLSAKTDAVQVQFGSASITGGTLNGAVSVTNGVTSATPSVVIGTEGTYDAPIVNGNVVIALSGASVNFYGGVIDGVEGQIPASATVASHFKSDISASLPTGMQCVQEDGVWIVQQLSEENAAAKIVSADGAESFFLLASTAASQLENGDTLVLLKDTTSQLVFDGVQAKVDLNGHKVESDSSPVISIPSRGADIVIESGSIVSTSTSQDASIVGIVGETFTADNVNLTLEGVELSMTGSGNAGIIVHGNNTNNTVTLDGCTLTVPNDVMGIYFPPKSGTLNINDTTINAGTGIGVKGGTVNITGDTVVTASGTPETPSEGGQSGIAETGAAIYVDGSYTDRIVQVNIEGGSFTSEQGEAVQMLFAEDRGEDVPATVEVTGGSFGDDSVEEYAAEGYGLVKNDDGTYGVHEHELVEVPAKEPTCTEDGNKTYWRCSICGDVFADKDMSEPTTLEDVAIPALNHEAVHVPAKDATQDEAGNIEYWQCSKCGKLFSDEAMTHEVSAADVVIPALGENGGEPAGGDNDKQPAGGGTQADAAKTGEDVPYLMGGAAVVAAVALVASVLAHRRRRQMR